MGGGEGRKVLSEFKTEKVLRGVKREVRLDGRVKGQLPVVPGYFRSLPAIPPAKWGSQLFGRGFATGLSSPHASTSCHARTLSFQISFMRSAMTHFSANVGCSRDRCSWRASFACSMTALQQHGNTGGGGRGKRKGPHRGRVTGVRQEACGIP